MLQPVLQPGQIDVGVKSEIIETAMAQQVGDLFGSGAFLNEVSGKGAAQDLGPRTGHHQIRLP